MNVSEHIASGIIENYVLGMASPEERLEFEKLCRQYPELEQARIRFEESLEEKALHDAVKPPAELKAKILDSIRAEQTPLAPFIEMEQPRNRRKIPGMRWAIAASVILLAGCLGIALFFYQKNQELQSEIAKTDKNIQQLDDKKTAIEEELIANNPNLKKLARFNNPGTTVPATINVYWDSTSTNVYLVIDNLATLPNGQRYQLWSVSKGRYSDLGLFDAPETDKLIMKMNNVQQADSFTITIADLNKPAVNNP